MKYKGLSKSQWRDFLCYCRNLPKVGMPESVNTKYKATSLAHWYWLWDTHGIRADYCRLNLAWRLVQAKETMNLTVKLWVEDIAKENCILHPKEVWEYCYQFPNWVWQSFVGQMRKEILPFRWQRIEYAPDGKTYWPPEQISFNPNI